MTDRSKNIALVALLALVAFLAGRQLAPARSSSELEASPAGPLLPQGRRSGTKKDAKTKAEPLVYESGGGVGASANGVIAVTGSYGIGTSVLYVVDTKARQLAVYEARGGSLNSRRLFLVGARRIDLDLQLEGYNDESEHSYDSLRKRFEAKGLETKR